MAKLWNKLFRLVYINPGPFCGSTFLVLAFAYMVFTIYNMLNIKGLYNICKPILWFFFYILSGIFHMFKTEVKAKNKAIIFPNSGCVLYAEIWIFFALWGQKSGCVLYAENYGTYIRYIYVGDCFKSGQLSR